MFRILTLFLLLAQPAQAGFTFASIDGGEIDLDGFRGQPVLVVNTASRCGYTRQYEGLQTLHERYGGRGLVVLAVPSDDFRQELDSARDVKAFCEVNFGLTLPMTDITVVKGRGAHPFFAWMRQEHGFAPRWNFNKILLGGDGNPVATFGANTRPLSPALIRRIEALLP